MAMYSAREMKDKMAGKSKVREIELQDNKQIKLWIPKNEFFFLKKHFNIQMIPKFKHALVRAITCINSDGNNGECPICQHIQDLWEQWRNTSDKTEKKDLQAQINRYSSEVYYINAVDISDKSFKCSALRLTSAMFRAISEVVNPEDGSEIDISHVIWTVKKTTKNNKVSYAIVEDTESETALKLTKNMAKICDRDEKDGGYIALDKAYEQSFSQSEYLHKLYGNASEYEELEETETVKKSKVKVVEDEDVSLDDIDVPEEPKKPSKPAKKSEPVKDETDDLDLESDDDEPPFETKKPAKKSEPVKDETDDLDLELDEDDPKSLKSDKPVLPAKKADKKAENLDDDDLDLEDIEF